VRMLLWLCEVRSFSGVVGWNQRWIGVYGWMQWYRWRMSTTVLASRSH
jgi:hypothetical protein